MSKCSIHHEILQSSSFQFGANHLFRPRPGTRSNTALDRLRYLLLLLRSCTFRSSTLLFLVSSNTVGLGLLLRSFGSISLLLFGVCLWLLCLTLGAALFASLRLFFFFPLPLLFFFLLALYSLVMLTLRAVRGLLRSATISILVKLTSTLYNIVAATTTRTISIYRRDTLVAIFEQ